MARPATRRWKKAECAHARDARNACAGVDSRRRSKIVASALRWFFQGSCAPFRRLLPAVHVRFALHIDGPHRRCVDRSACAPTPTPLPGGAAALRHSQGSVSRISPARFRVAGLLLLLTLLLGLSAPLPLARIAPPRAQALRGPVEIGTTFSPRRAAAAGIDYQAGFRTLLAMGFRVIRLSAYWSEIDRDGYGELDWLMDEARRAGQPVVLTVGIKAVGWPEFYVPAEAFSRTPGDGQDAAMDEVMRARALTYIEATVRRYREYPNLLAWQVENEPLNRTGPHRWWIDREFLRLEVERVTSLAPQVPIIVNSFGHFNLILDRASAPSIFDLGVLLGFDSGGAERDILALLRPGDILGLDVYMKIGYRFLGSDHYTQAAADWPEQIGRWRAIAGGKHKRVWITEAQAEPWMVSPDSRPSFSADRMERLFDDLKGEGFSTILLWGSEYWLASLERGDPSWMQTVEHLLQRERALN